MTDEGNDAHAGPGAARMEAALAESEERFRAVFEHSFDAVLVTTPTGGVLEANPAACALFGFELEEIRALGRRGLVDEADPRVWRMIEEQERTGRTRGELTLKRKDGSRFPGEMSSMVYRTREGDRRASVVVRDLTSRKAAERAAEEAYGTLLARIQRFAEEVNLASDRAAIHDALFRFARASAPADALFVSDVDPETGACIPVYATGVLGGSTGARTVAASDGTVHDDDPQARALREGDAVIVDDPPPAPTKAPYGSAVALPMTAKGRVTGVMELRSRQPAAFRYDHVVSLRVAAGLAAVATQDVRLLRNERRARKRAEADRQHLRELMDQSPVMMTTLEGPEHVFTSANRRYLEALGLTRDIIGQRVVDVLPEIEAQGIVEILDRVRHTGEPFAANGLPVDLDVHGGHKQFHFNLVYQPLRNEEGEVTGILANVNDVTPQVEASARLERLNVELRDAYDETIAGWAHALDLKDAETAGHSHRVTRWTVELARHLGIDGEDLEHVRRGALLHDIGKMGVPDHILRKPGPLSDEEWRAMKSHTTYAAELLRPIAFLRPALDVPLHHHERWDGSGYPAGLPGQAIPLAARIFAIIDVFDALTNDRPYRAAWPASEARAHIRAEAGRHFDPAVAAAFEQVVAPRIRTEGDAPLPPRPET